MLIILSLLFALVIFHFQKHSIPTLALLVLALVPLGFTILLNLIGFFVGVAFTASMMKVDLPAIAGRRVGLGGRKPRALAWQARMTGPFGDSSKR